MAQIFVSYSRDDRSRVQALLSVLFDQGWNIWRDTYIAPGERFDGIIRTELDRAEVVVVIWSESSVGKDYVLAEASQALRRNVLVPILIDDVDPPLEFARLEFADLRGWPNLFDNGELQRLLSSLGARLNQQARNQSDIPNVIRQSVPAASRTLATQNVTFGLLITWAVLSGLQVFLPFADLNLLLVIPLATILLAVYWNTRPRNVLLAAVGFHAYNLVLVLASHMRSGGRLEKVAWWTILSVAVVNALIVGVIAVWKRPDGRADAA